MHICANMGAVPVEFFFFFFFCPPHNKIHMRRTASMQEGTKPLDATAVQQQRRASFYPQVAAYLEACGARASLEALAEGFALRHIARGVQTRAFFPSAILDPPQIRISSGFGDSLVGSGCKVAHVFEQATGGRSGTIAWSGCPPDPDSTWLVCEFASLTCHGGDRIETLKFWDSG